MSNNTDDSDARHGPPPATGPAAEYRVGYGRPPLHSRFKPGQVANPKGRPRKNTVLRRTLLTPTTVVVGNQRETMLLIDILLMRAKSRALAGDRHALNYLLGLEGGRILARHVASDHG